MHLARTSVSARAAVLTLVAVCVLLGIHGCKDAQPQSAKQTPAAFRSQFSSATSDRAKRDVVLAAIDAGTIRAGMPVDELRSLFEGADSEAGATVENIKSEIVNFVPLGPPPPNEPTSAMKRRGWYFVIKHDGSVVVNYYLSDSHFK